MEDTSHEEKMGNSWDGENQRESPRFYLKKKKKNILVESLTDFLIHTSVEKS